MINEKEWVDRAVATAIGYMFVEIVSARTGANKNLVRDELKTIIEDEHAAPENIRCWFENNA